MYIATIILQVSIWPPICLLGHGNLVGTTQPDIDFPKEITNKGTVAGESRGINVSTTIDD